jgi:hypothetical protein
MNASILPSVTPMLSAPTLMEASPACAILDIQELALSALVRMDCNFKGACQ